MSIKYLLRNSVKKMNFMVIETQLLMLHLSFISLVTLGTNHLENQNCN